MKKTIFILILILVGSIVAGFILYREWRDTANELSVLKYIQSMPSSGTTTPILPITPPIVDTVTGTVTQIYKPLSTTGPIEGYVSKSLADSLAKALGVATKDVDRYKSMVATLEAKGKGERTQDTTRMTEWLVLKNDPTFDVRVNLGNDSIYTGVRLALDQAYAPYKRNIFSRTEYKSVIRARDPRVVISNVFEVNKVPKSPRWGIGVSAGPVVTPTGLTWGAMLGVSYDLIQF